MLVPVDLLADAVDSADFVLWSEWALARVGFRPSNCLAIVGLCRDELMDGVQHDISSVWGQPFSIGALGGMVFLGRTGLSAALSHVPGEDGRHRFVVYCLPHIGIDSDGTVGRVQRRGMSRASTACGALDAFRRQLVDGGAATGIDPDDVEQSLLRRRLSSLLDASVGPPSLAELTELARQAADADVRRYIDLARGEEPVDVACISGIVVHGPDGADFVTSVHADVTIDDDVIPLPH